MVNSQLGPVLPTELPSGHIFASIVQAFMVADGVLIFIDLGEAEGEAVSTTIGVEVGIGVGEETGV